MSLEKKFNKRLIGLIMGEKYVKEEDTDKKPGFIETGINEFKKSLFPQKKKKSTPPTESVPNEGEKKEEKSDSHDEEDW